MDPDGARRLNRSSPSCLNSGAQRTDFFHGLLIRVQENWGRPIDCLLLERAIPALDDPVGFRLFEEAEAGVDAPVPKLVEEVVRQLGQ